MEALYVFIAILGGNVILLMAVAFLGKTLIAHLLKKDIDNYKSELKAKADIAIEQLKNELHMLAMEREVKFTKLHEKRASIIAELYSLLIETEYSMNGYINTLEENAVTEFVDPALNKACSNLIDVIKFINKNSIYLPESDCKVLDDYVRELCVPAMYHLTSKNSVDKDTAKKLIAFWKGSGENLKQAKLAIKHEMRVLLGDDTI